MPKQLKELRNFISGITSSPSAADIPDESPIYSKNLEAIDEEGKLRGAKEDVAKLQEVGPNVMVFNKGGSIFDEGAITSVEYKFVCYDDSEKYTNTNTITTHWQNKWLYKQISNTILGSKYVSAVHYKPHKFNTETNTDVAPSFYTTGVTNGNALGAADTVIEFASGALGDPSDFNGATWAEVGRFIKINNTVDTGNTDEVCKIAAVNYVADGVSSITVERGVPDMSVFPDLDTTAQIWTAGNEILALGDYFGIDVTFHESLESPTAEVSRAGVNWNKFDNSNYLDLNARDLMLVSNRDDGQTFTRHNLVVYTKDATSSPPEYKLKVLKNFYEEGGEPMTLVVPNDADVHSNDEGYPESVSLARGPNATFIGTGSAISSKPQWLGEIQHDRFGQKLEGFFLEDAELKAIDDDQTIFAINNMEYPLLYDEHTGTPSIDANTKNRSNNFVLGASSSGRFFYLVRNNANFVNNGSNGYTLEPKNAVGKQFKHDTTLGYIPSVISCSKDMSEKMSNSSLSDHWPYFNVWKHAADNPVSDGTAIDGHLNTSTVKTTYVWTADVTASDRLYAYAIQWYDPSDGSNSDTEADMKMNILQLGGNGYLELTHRIYVDQNTKDKLGLNLDTTNDDGDPTYINRPPKSGAFITDIFEKGNFIYILYGHKSGFTFDEEWLYVVDMNDIATNQSLAGQRVNAKPITPPALKVKNFGKDYHNAGKDWWMPEDCFKSGLQSMSWIGQDGGYGAYANHVKWRNCDALGFNGHKKHIAYNRNINGLNVEPDTSSYWNKSMASKVDVLSDNDPMRCPGYTIYDNLYDDDTSSRQGNNPYVDPNYGGWYNEGLGGTYQSSANNIDFGPTYGFENYVVYPQPQGLINYEDRNDIGVIAFLDGKQIQSGIEIQHKRKSFSEGLFTWKRQHSLWNKTEPVIVNFNEYVMFACDPGTYGVSQRCVPYGTTYHRNYQKQFGNGTSWDIIVENKDTSFKNVNGIDPNPWTDVANTIDESEFDGEEYTLNAVVRKRPQKNAFRFGTYANFNTTSTGAGAKYQPSDEVQKAYNRHIYPFGTGVSSQAGQEGNSEIATKPDQLNAAVSVARNYDQTDSNEIIMSVKNVGRPQYNTYITRWPVNTISDTYATKEPISSPLSPLNTFNPLLINNVGNGCIQMTKIDANKYEIIVSPTTGDFQTGFLRYNDLASDTYDLATSLDDGAIDYSDSTYGSYFHKHQAGGLDFGLSINFTSKVTDQHDDDGDDVLEYVDGNFMANTTYYWKMTLLYDGYQEGPLSQFFFSQPTDEFNYNQVILTLRVSDPPNRVSHIVLYRKNAVNDYYRMVGECDLAKGWTHLAERDIYQKQLVDEGKLGPTYEAVTGMPETLRETIVNYKLSTVAQGHLIVADCYHPEIKQGQNFMFKSQPNAYSNFNWSRDYCVLPTKPTCIKWWAGKLYAFDLANMYRINLDNLVLEDTFEGIGCISEDTAITTDIGMFFADYQGMYWHNGNKAENISRDIVQSSWAGDLTDIIEETAAADQRWQFHNWQNINHNIPPKILFNPMTQSVYYCFQDKHPNDNAIFNGAWVYGLGRKRWDLIETPVPEGSFTGIKNDIYLSGGNKLWQIAKSGNERKKWSFYTKTFDFGGASQDKTFANINVIFNNSVDAASMKAGTGGNIKFLVDGDEVASNLVNTKQDKNKVTYRLAGSVKKGKKLQVQLSLMTVEVDSIGIVYKSKSVK